MKNVKKNNEFSFSDLFDRFIRYSEKGRRLQPNGRRLSPGTVETYKGTRKLLIAFSQKQHWPLRLKDTRTMNQREIQVEQHYWKKFYREFTNFLYDHCLHRDNYVGQNIKIIKIFFNYLKKDLAINIGEFHKQFYAWKEEIAIYPLLPEELNYLIFDKALELKLCKRLKETKDFFVFGCTVALRVSDLLRLKRSDIRITNEHHYLITRSIKTNLESGIRLPDYAKEIIERYAKSRSLLPHFNKDNLNIWIKRLLEIAGFTQPVHRTRNIRGKAELLKNKIPRFCDVATTHTMRRTAITTMLCLGMPEQVVRKISGHSPGSKEFYRYVSWAQLYQDKETDAMFEKLKQKKTSVATENSRYSTTAIY
jgi:integrase